MQRELRIAWVSITIVMLLLLGIEVATQLKLISDRKEGIQAEALRMVHGLETEQWRLVDDIQHIAGTLVTVGEELLGPQCQSSLDHLTQYLPGYLTVQMMGLQGTVQCATDKRTIGAFIGDRDNVRNALALGGFAIGGYSTTRKIGDAVLTFAQPMSEPDGKPAGAVTLLLNLNWLDAYLGRNPFPAGTVVLIADRNGKILARSPPQPDMVGRPLPDALGFMLTAGQEGTTELDWPDVGERITAYVPPRARLPGIMIAVGVDKAAALRPAYAAMWRSLATFGGVLALCYAFAIWSARKLIRVQENLVLALEAGRAGTTDQDLETGKWRWSAETFRIFGLDPRKHPPSFETWKAVLHPDDYGRVLEERAAQLKSRSPALDIEFRVLRGEGEVAWVHSLCRIHYTAEGKARRINGLYIDVTARRLFEEELQISREHMGMALEAANAGAWEWRIADDQISWSDEVYRQRGLDPVKAGKPTKELWASTLDPEDRETFLAEMQAVLAQQRTTFSIDGRIITPDGITRWITRTGRVFYDDHHQAERMVGITLDITERKDAEAGLRSQKEEAERASFSKSRFLAAASHDLRQPVQSMMLFAHALDAQLKHHPASRIVRKLMDAQDSLKELLDSLLDLTKLDAGLVTPEIKAVNVKALIEPLAAAYQARAAHKGLKFRSRFCDGWVSTDPTLFSRILNNLLDNAIKYTQRGGVILIFRASDGHIYFDVVDTGVGISQEHIGMVFQEFYQIGESGREQKQGMGLGLATVKRLAELLGHQITVHSRLGRGSRFTVTAAPADKPSQLPARTISSSQSRSPGAHRRVLVVDDEGAILDGMKVMLEQWGYEPMTVSNLADALEKMEQLGTPDALVVDFRLGAGVTGIDVVTALRDSAGLKIPAILLTGDTAVRMRGDFTVLYKPVSPEQLNRTLADVCEARAS